MDQLKQTIINHIKETDTIDVEMLEKCMDLPYMQFRYHLFFLVKAGMVKKIKKTKPTRLEFSYIGNDVQLKLKDHIVEHQHILLDDLSTHFNMTKNVCKVLLSEYITSGELLQISKGGNFIVYYSKDSGLNVNDLDGYLVSHVDKVKQEESEKQSDLVVLSKQFLAKPSSKKWNMYL